MSRLPGIAATLRGVRRTLDSQDCRYTFSTDVWDRGVRVRSRKLFDLKPRAAAAALALDSAQRAC
jgi:hypothetical protein